MNLMIDVHNLVKTKSKYQLQHNLDHCVIASTAVQRRKMAIGSVQTVWDNMTTQLVWVVFAMNLLVAFFKERVKRVAEIGSEILQII
jgi:hypothetical protein